MSSPQHRLSEDQAADFLRDRFPGIRALSNAEILAAIEDCKRSLDPTAIRHRMYAEMIIIGCCVFALGGVSSKAGYFWPAVILLPVLGGTVMVARIRSMARRALNQEFARRYGEGARSVTPDNP